MKKTFSIFNFQFSILLFFVFCLLSCNRSECFTVEGNIANSEGKTLYLTHHSLLKNTVLDSIKLKSDGSFRFRAPRPEYPDFYRLILDRKQITFVIDSTETVKITSQFQNFAMNYTVENSEVSQKIQILRQSLNEIQQSLDRITPQTPSDTRFVILEDIEKDIETHKALAREIILENPCSMAAYFALHQQINRSFLFSPYEQDDKKYYNAVANTFHVFMSDYERSKSMYATALDAIQTQREELRHKAWRKVLEEFGKNYIDIVLPDKNGITQRLSALEGKKTVLIDFSSSTMPKNVDYIFTLRDLYNKYATRGLSIFQVSLDKNKLFWEQSVENLPWTCVLDENGTVSTAYNIQSIPTLFILNKKGQLIRVEELNKLEEQIRKEM